MDNKIRVGIAHGDINGISYELIVNIMDDSRMLELCTPIIYGSSKVAAYHRKTLNLENVGFNSIQSAENANPKRCNIINCVDDEAKVELGQSTEEADRLAMIALKRALEDLDNGDIDVLVLAPQNASSFHKENSNSLVDFLGRKYRSRNTLPIVVGEQFKLSYLTNMMGLKDVVDQITPENCFYKVKQLIKSLEEDFTVRSPKIAVLGINPHADQELGGEEDKLLVPGIERLREYGYMALGPYSPERIFSGTEYQKFDCVLAMYHDQGKLPFNMIEGTNGATLIAGLPVIITTTAQGVGYDIVGQGKAELSGLRNAIYLAIDSFKQREQNAELSENPLKHYDIGGNSNETDINVEQLVGVSSREETIDTL